MSEIIELSKLSINLLFFLTGCMCLVPAMSGKFPSIPVVTLPSGSLNISDRITAGVISFILFAVATYISFYPPEGSFVKYRVNDVANNDTLAIRLEPNPSTKKVGFIPPDGKDIKVTGMCRLASGSNIWVPIKYQNIKGWVNAIFLAEQ